MDFISEKSLDWETNALFIFSDGLNFYCGTLNDDCYEKFVRVPEFLDILLRKPEFITSVCDYATKKVFSELKPENVYDFIKALDDSEIDQIWEGDNLLKLTTEDSLYIDNKDHSKNELKSLEPLEKILKNLYLNFYEDYKDSEKVSMSGSILFPVKDKVYEFPEDEGAYSYLTIKKQNNLIMSSLHLGGRVNLSCIGPDCFKCLEIIATRAKMISYGDFGTYVNQKKDSEDEKKFHEQVNKYCVVGLSEEASKFRQQMHSPDGKNF